MANQKYKRHRGDSIQQCPYCGTHYLWSIGRYVRAYKSKWIDIKCSGCGKMFYVNEHDKIKKEEDFNGTVIR